jgi:hypothetical protein
VATLTGLPGIAYTIAIEPVVHIRGSVAGNPLKLTFSPTMNFDLGS